MTSQWQLGRMSEDFQPALQQGHMTLRLWYGALNDFWSAVSDWYFSEIHIFVSISWQGNLPFWLGMPYFTLDFRFAQPAKIPISSQNVNLQSLSESDYIYSI